MCWKRESDCRYTGHQRACSEKQLCGWRASTTRHHPLSSVASGPISKLFMKKTFVPSHVYNQPETSNWKFRLALTDPVFLNWVDWNLAKSKETMVMMIVILSWTLALCQTLFHVILLSVWGGDYHNSCFLKRGLNFHLILKLVIVRTRTENQTQTAGSCLSCCRPVPVLCPQWTCGVRPWSVSCSLQAKSSCCLFLGGLWAKSGWKK